MMFMWEQPPRLSGGPGISGRQLLFSDSHPIGSWTTKTHQHTRRSCPEPVEAIPEAQHAVSSKAPTNSITL